MVIKVYISGISGLKEVKKRQQRICMILDSKHIGYHCIDITESGRDDEKKFLQEKCTTGDQSKFPMTPQVFNEDDYCGDYDQFDLANENDTLETFLKLPPTSISSANLNLSNGLDKKKDDIEITENINIEMSQPNDIDPVKHVSELGDVEDQSLLEGNKIWSQSEVPENGGDSVIHDELNNDSGNAVHDSSLIDAQNISNIPLLEDEVTNDDGLQVQEVKTDFEQEENTDIMNNEELACDKDLTDDVAEAVSEVSETSEEINDQ